MKNLLTCFWMVGFLGLPMLGGDLPTPVAAKLLSLISRGAGENGKVATKDADMGAEITKAGGTVDLGGRVAWAREGGEVRLFSMQKKCVVVNDPKFFSMGAGIAIYEEGGKPKLVLNQRGIAASGVQLSDAIVKAALGQ